MSEYILFLPDLVLEAESINSGARLTVSKCALIDEEEEDEAVRDSVPHHPIEDPDTKQDDLMESHKL